MNFGHTYTKKIIVLIYINHGSPYNMSAVYYVSIPKNSGKFVFQFKINDSIDNRMFINPVESHYI
jgi:hypothetical protein